VLLAPASAQAGFGVQQWEAGTCSSDTPTCSYKGNRQQFFTQVAGRADFGIVNFKLNTDPGGAGEGKVRDIRVDLPPGLSVNPEAVPRCTEAELGGPGGPELCGARGAKVGTVTVSAFQPPKTSISLTTSVFNVVPKEGEPAEFGFFIPIVNALVLLEGTASWEGDYHEGFTIRQAPNLEALGLTGARLVFEGSRGDGGLVTVGSDCHGSTTSTLTVDSYEAPQLRLPFETTPIGPGDTILPTGCDLVPFSPGFALGVGASAVDSPTTLSARVEVPFDPSAPIAQSHLKRAVVTLPKGMGLNPAAAGALQACGDAAFGKGQMVGDRITDPAAVRPPQIACPAGSQIGTVAIDTPVLPKDSLAGKLYLGEQLSRDPASGREYRVFLDAEAPRFGVYVRLLGALAADPATGQLTATFDEPAYGGLPQVPFRTLSLDFDRAGGLLTSPPTCGEHLAGARLTPWSGNADATFAPGFGLSAAPGGGTCPKTLAERRFAPSFSAKLDGARARAFSPLRLELGRSDGQQELKGADLTLPPGLTAKLAGIPYCPEAAIAAAAGRAGGEERRASSCPAASRVGSASVLAGSGPSPVRIDGSAYLAGPYKGAPLSLAVVIPALAGPFDLGASVVRVALFVDPETARIRAVSDPLPDVFGGAKLDLRSVALSLDQKEFVLAGTSCAGGMSIAGALRGGGANPASPAAFSTAAVSEPFALTGCEGLGFRPKVGLRLAGATRRSKHPSLRVTLSARDGDADLASASVALPHALIVNQARLANICTRPQFAAGQCPKGSVYGHARAYSPLLSEPLEGPVYLRSSNHRLPDLVAHLEGQITIDLDGRLDTFHGGVRTTFATLPDVPVSKFALTIPGGKRGLLVASTDLCRHHIKAIARFKAQNGRKLNGKPALKTRCRRPHRRQR